MLVEVTLPEAGIKKKKKLVQPGLYQDKFSEFGRGHI